MYSPDWTAGFYIVFRTFKANSFTAGNIKVGDGQKVVTTGPYATLRHPMYSGALLLLLCTPIALGSWWALLTFIPMCGIIIAGRFSPNDHRQFSQELMQNFANFVGPIMDIQLLNKIKRLAIIALASDDQLMQTLVLKGGNAIDLTFNTDGKVFSRASFDLDFSIDGGDFEEEQELIAGRIRRTLERTFLEQQLYVIDFTFTARPRVPQPANADFWGGYLGTFKIVDKEVYQRNRGNPRALQRQSVALRLNNSPVFELDFSKYEYVGQKTPLKIDGYRIYVYTAEMIVLEKLRAICQQLPEYRSILPSHVPRGRARDFYDIWLIMDQQGMDPSSPENLTLIGLIFAAKRVPLSFIDRIHEHLDLHREDWNSVVLTVDPTERLQPFDYYADYVIRKFGPLTFQVDSTAASF